MENWQPGDLALCVVGGPPGNYTKENFGFPEAGKIYHVVDLFEQDFGVWNRTKIWWLEFSDAPMNVTEYIFTDGDNLIEPWKRAWGARRFVKVTPEEMDDEDLEVITLMNSPEFSECL